jgi:L-fucose isomerase
MRKYKVGILTFSDGRKYIHERHYIINQRYQKRLQNALEETGIVEVTAGTDIIGNPAIAHREGLRMRQAGVDVTILNYAIWCYPHFSAIAACSAPGPFLLFSNLNPGEPGMVAMLAAAGTMDQLGYPYERVWGDIGDEEVLQKVMRFIQAACAVSMLRGQTFGTFGGRPLGMYTAVSNLDQWQSLFGVDIEFNEQWDIIHYADRVNPLKVKNARKWLESRIGSIEYDGKALTPEKLEKAIRSYYALRELIEERHLDFIGVKAQGDLTENFVTMDLAEAFLNDPYDWDGPHEPIIAATESDMDGALTMQLFKLITRGEPVLFSDVRHYDKNRDVWYFSNSGMHPTFFAGRSKNPEENLKLVTLYPEISDYPAGGPSVHHFAASGSVTLARLARKSGKYWMAIVPGEFIEFPREEALLMGATVTPQWPIAFTRLRVPAEEFLSYYPCNHIHGVYGNYVEELQLIAKILGIEVRLFSG